MYDQITLEKGMYHLANRTFTEALEAADPSAQYQGTPLANLDAYERQLKRFDIHVSGKHCDNVEKFFTTTQSAVLFPEFIRRAVRQGMEESILPELTAASAQVRATAAKGFTVNESAGGYGTPVDEGESFTATAIRETDDAIALAKYGRLITASYETVRTQRIDIFAVMLRAVGRKLAAAIAGSALTAVTGAVTPIETASTSLAYADLTNLYAQFTDYDLTTVVASPAVIGTILAMEQMAERTLDANGNVRLPFGAKLIASSALDDKTLVGISKDYAVACLIGSDVTLESDRLIDCQLDRIAVSVRVGFQPLMTGAAAVLEVKTGA